jgi:hypothetical protein
VKDELKIDPGEIGRRLLPFYKEQSTEAPNHESGQDCTVSKMPGRKMKVVLQVQPFLALVGSSPGLKEKAFKLLQRITSLFETTFRDLGEPPAIAQAKANLFVNSWQGAIVVARAGGGLEHLRKVFRDLKEMVDLS